MSTIDERSVLLRPADRAADRAADKWAVEQSVQIALHRSGYAVLRRVIGEFDDGRLTLRGQVPTFYLKQVAGSAVARVAGVVWIDNQLEVA